MAATKGKRRRYMGDRAAPRGRSYILIGKNPKTGEWHGYCENSFSMSYIMGWARVWRSNDEYYEPAAERTVDHLRSAEAKIREQQPSWNWRIYRVGSDACPVKVNWKHFYDLKREGKLDKFKYRNLNISV